MAFHQVARGLIDWVMRDADAVVTYGSHVSRALLESGVSKDRMFLAPQAIDNDLFLRPVKAADRAAYRESLGISSADVLALYVGRLVLSKGVRTLIRAFAELASRHKHLQLAIVGSGDDEPQLRQLTNELRMADRVKFIGRVPNTRLPVIFQSSDIMVVPSEPTNEGAEPWGLVVNEAMASGCALLVSDAVGAASHGVPEDGKSGLVFHAGDVSGLAATLERLVVDGPLRNALGMVARAHVQELTYDGMAEGMLAAVEFASGAARTSSGIRS
jgi:glycosyltransferase involved in cell wall biosynthesis